MDLMVFLAIVIFVTVFSAPLSYVRIAVRAAGTRSRR